MNLSTFDFNETPVRVIVDDGGAPWFVAADVCRVLDLSNTSMALQGLDEADLSNTEVRSESENGVVQARKMNTISEAGLYQLVFASRKPEARDFKRWVTREVLPAIRKTGRYEWGGEVAGEDAEVRDIRQIVAMTIKGLWAGTVPVGKATAIFTGAKLHWQMQCHSDEGAEPDAIEIALPASDEQDFLRLLAWMVAQGERTEFTPGELRRAALEQGLFPQWLKFSEADTPRVMARFGKLCEAALDRRHEGRVLASRGINRHRRYYVATLAVRPEEAK